jgi:hypothetical protein
MSPGSGIFISLGRALSAAVIGEAAGGDNARQSHDFVAFRRF